MLASIMVILILWCPGAESVSNTSISVFDHDGVRAAKLKTVDRKKFAHLKSLAKDPARVAYIEHYSSSDLHRRMQSDWDTTLKKLIPDQVAQCSDLYATNYGQLGVCTYDCNLLADNIFKQAGQPRNPTRCYAFDSQTMTWPNELLRLRDNNNTVAIPIAESWIVQGTMLDGLPVILDARFSSGTWQQVTHASMAFRFVRFSGQRAPLDKYVKSRRFDDFPTARLGGALAIEGGHGSFIILDNVVFDHNRATSGGAIFIDGRLDVAAADIARDNTINIFMSGCVFWANQADYAGGAARIQDSWPFVVRIEDTQFVDNTAYIAQHYYWVALQGATDRGFRGLTSTP
jgi:predicted outer membrane repeat protein